ncbi:twin-arginine translocase subunit TatB, partial [Dietzia sp. SLG310A2-38A2]|nr:twin-arginine translocase subunit TatB [Dietzia sp. SLG310A2-38A2]
RGMSPRAMVTKHLLDGDDSLFTGDFGAAAPAGGPQSTGPQATGPQSAGPPSTGARSTAPQPAGPASSSAPTPPRPGTTPMWDTDAT